MEGSFHAELKEWFKKPGDELEVPVDGYVIDVVRNDLLVVNELNSPVDFGFKSIYPYLNGDNWQSRINLLKTHRESFTSMFGGVKAKLLKNQFND